MCDAGRIRHHLKHNLWRKDSTILFVGHQSVGTLGRIIQDGATEVKLFGEIIQVSAEIRRLSGVSGHADRDGLIKWLTGFEKKPERVFVVHGDDQVCNIFTEYIRNELGYKADAPYSGMVYDLKTNLCLDEGKIVRIESKHDTARADSVFERLVQAGRRLAAVIQHNKGGANKDLSKFMSQINSLCDKWDQ
jgi:metallo-beta-lactamase family protein